MATLKQSQSTEGLKAVDQRLAKCIEEFDRYILLRTGEAYRKINLLFNPMLSRVPFASGMLGKMVFEDLPFAQTWFFGFFQIVRFYARGLLRFTHYSMMFVYIKLGRGRLRPAVWSDNSKLAVIDTFVLVDQILRDGTFQEQYFSGLPELLQEMGLVYVIFPVLDRYPLSLCQAYKVVQALRFSAHPIVTEFDFLKLADFAALFVFIIIYPVDVIRFAKSVRGASKLDALFCAELVNTLHQSMSPISGFIRYLSAKRLAKSAKCHINLFSWCENQVIDKGLYRGLRECASSALIYACQNYVAYPAYVNMRIAESEIEAQVTPDIILVNGSDFLRKSDKFQYRLGPSLRYKWVFSETGTGVGKSGCVICLSYLPDLNNEILGICSAADSLSDLPIPVRAHPAFANHSLPRLPNNWYYTEKKVPQLLRDGALLVTSESGTAIEAAAVGTSVIIIASQSSFTCNPMLQTGKGELWDIAFDPSELDAVYSHLLLVRQNNPIRIQELSKYYRTHCFVEPTVEAIKNAFDL